MYDFILIGRVYQADNNCKIEGLNCVKHYLQNQPYHLGSRWKYSSIIFFIFLKHQLTVYVAQPNAITTWPSSVMSCIVCYRVSIVWYLNGYAYIHVCLLFMITMIKRKWCHLNVSWWVISMFVLSCQSCSCILSLLSLKNQYNHIVWYHVIRSLFLILFGMLHWRKK